MIGVPGSSGRTFATAALADTDEEIVEAAQRNSEVTPLMKLKLNDSLERGKEINKFDTKANQFSLLCVKQTSLTWTA